MTITFLIHVFSTVFMTGVSWFVQIVHYPLFREIPIAEFTKYERKNFVTAYVTVPVMVAELLSGVYLFFESYSTLFLINMVLLAVIEISTVVFQIPIQLKLSKNASLALMSKLVKTNWIRTICWSARSIVLAVLLLNGS